MNALLIVGAGWLGLNVVVVVLAWVFRDKSGRSDRLDFHERMDLRR